jgi:acyl-coenzyme A synthetase/AMP-(fatty) acid ligase
MLTRRIFEWAARAPSKLALIGPDRQRTYADFAYAIARARGYFIRKGVIGPGMVSIAVENQAEVWALSLALRSLGVTTMNRGFDTADAPLLRCAVKSVAEEVPRLRELCAAHAMPLLEVSLDDEAPVGLDDGPRPERPGGQILHTSGTTGVHKKVLIDPSFEDVMLERRSRGADIDEDTVFSPFTCPVWTGAGYKSPAAVWSAGGTVVIDRTSPYAPLLQPTLTQGLLTPLILRTILAAPADAFPYNEQLRLTYTGGTLRWSEIEEARRRIAPRVFNALGATETSTFGRTLIKTPDDLRWHRPAPDAPVEVVDDDDRPLPAGRIGRIRISAEGGPDGYLNDDGATATFFRHGYFYPGDLGELREDGWLALQGRVTEIINIDGVKIPPGPIEERLREAIGAQVVLLTMQNDAGEEELHVAIEAPALPATETLSKALWAEFRQAIRAHVHAVGVFPRNAMGKIMRPQLAAQITAADRTAPAPPQS